MIIHTALTLLLFAVVLYKLISSYHLLGLLNGRRRNHMISSKQSINPDEYVSITHMHSKVIDKSIPAKQSSINLCTYLEGHKTKLNVKHSSAHKLVNIYLTRYVCNFRIIMTSSNWNIFHGTGPLCGEFTGHRCILLTEASDAGFDVFFDLRLSKRLSKQSWGWWFETPSRSLFRHCNELEWICCSNYYSWGHGFQ